MSHQFNLFLFDWSGTISDDRRPVYEANQRMGDVLGVPRISFEAWLPKTTLTVYDFFREAGVDMPDDELWALYKRVFDEVNSEQHLPVVYEDAHRAIGRIRAVAANLAILSAHPQSNLSAEAAAYGLAPLFDVIQGDARDKSEGIRALAASFGVPNDYVVYIGDTTHDIRHARNAGVPVVAITTGYHTREQLEPENPDWIVNSLTELADLFTSSPSSLH